MAQSVSAVLCRMIPASSAQLWYLALPISLPSSHDRRQGTPLQLPNQQTAMISIFRAIAACCHTYDSEPLRPLWKSSLPDHDAKRILAITSMPRPLHTLGQNFLVEAHDFLGPIFPHPYQFVSLMLYFQVFLHWLEFTPWGLTVKSQTLDLSRVLKTQPKS